MTIGPAAHAAAIRALEGQQAAYRRYAGRVEAEREALSNRHPDQLLELARRAGADFRELEDGARGLRPHLEAARDDRDPSRAAELRRLVEAVRREAVRAEQQIRGLQEDLERWRDEYALRLGEMGMPLPGAPPAPGGGGARGYGADAPQKPVLVDRRG